MRKQTSFKRLQTLLLFCSLAQASYAHVLTSLRDVEQIALAKATELKQLQASSHALAHKSVAMGQLSDPSLSFGAMNFPTDTFSISQEPMTQIQIGLQQMLPPGDTLYFRHQQYCHLTHAEKAKLKLKKLDILRKTRLAWITLYYWQQVDNLIHKQKKVFQHLIEVTNSLLANDKAQQKDVLRAQLELTALGQKQIKVGENITIARAELARWIGRHLAYSCRPYHYPAFHKMHTKLWLTNKLVTHPLLQIDSESIYAKRSSLALTKQKYKPGVTVVGRYSFRHGSNANGVRRANFVSLMANVTLPLFVNKRQDQETYTAEAELNAFIEHKKTSFHELNLKLAKFYSMWVASRRQMRLYSHQYIPQSKQYTQSTLHAYENTKTDFPTLAMAHVQDLKIKLDALSARYAEQKAKIEILFLEGE